MYTHLNFQNANDLKLKPTLVAPQQIQISDSEIAYNTYARINCLNFFFNEGSEAKPRNLIEKLTVWQEKALLEEH